VESIQINIMTNKSNAILLKAILKNAKKLHIDSEWENDVQQWIERVDNSIENAELIEIVEA